MQLVGIHRIRRPSGTSFEVPESSYRKKGYQPPLDSLPWCHEPMATGKAE